MREGLIVDLFAGGGGASVALAAALGREPDIAINHDPVALAVHQANHPQTKHLTADIWDVTPRDAVRGRRVAVLWASPDCTHFSVAKGDVPRNHKIRSLAWVVVKWADQVRPDVIFLENVREFQGWGPLGRDGKPVKARMGETFRRWKRALERLGYVVDHRILDASQYGSPTRRRRLFLVARCDGKPIVWPEATHGPGLAPFRTAAECIDWTLPCPSIFERKRPLAEKTMWRIAQGLKRYVLENPKPFVVTVNHGKREWRGHGIDEPLTTVTGARRGHAVVIPHVTKFQENSVGQDAREPLDTVMTGAQRFGVVAPSLVEYHNATSPNGHRAATLDGPLPVQTTANRFGLVAPVLVQNGNGERKGQRARAMSTEKPLGTVMAGGTGGNGKHALVQAFLAKSYGDPLRKSGGGPVIGAELDAPVPTVTARDHHSLVTAHLATFRGTSSSHPGCASVDEPMPTISAGGERGGVHVAQVRAFLSAYYGSDGTGGQELLEPMRTVTAKHRLGLVTVEGREYQIVDIGFRMLEPHELLRAQFGAFADSYDLSAATTKAGKVRLIGNSVAPECARALVEANMPRLGEAAA